MKKMLWLLPALVMLGSCTGRVAPAIQAPVLVRVPEALVGKAPLGDAATAAADTTAAKPSLGEDWEALTAVVWQVDNSFTSRLVTFARVEGEEAPFTWVYTTATGAMVRINYDPLTHKGVVFLVGETPDKIEFTLYPGGGVNSQHGLALKFW